MGQGDIGGLLRGDDLAGGRGGRAVAVIVFDVVVHREDRPAGGVNLVVILGVAGVELDVIDLASVVAVQMGVEVDRVRLAHPGMGQGDGRGVRLADQAVSAAGGGCVVGTGGGVFGGSGGGVVNGDLLVRRGGILVGDDVGGGEVIGGGGVGLVGVVSGSAGGGPVAAGSESQSQAEREQKSEELFHFVHLSFHFSVEI